MKKEKSLFGKIKDFLTKPSVPKSAVSIFRSRVNPRLLTREHKRWENGWKRHCATRSQIRRIGSRKRAIELGIIPA